MSEPKGELPESLRGRTELIAIGYLFDSHAEAQEAVTAGLVDADLFHRSLFLVFISTGKPGVQLVEAYDRAGNRRWIDAELSSARVLPRGSPWLYRVAATFHDMDLPPGVMSVLLSLRDDPDEKLVWPRLDLN